MANKRRRYPKGRQLSSAKPQVYTLPAKEKGHTMTRRLNGWQRIGIVLSVLWAVGAAIHVRNSDLEGANRFADLSYKVCTNEKLLAHGTDSASCDQKRQDAITKWMKDGNSNMNVAIGALLPIPFGWLAGFILLYVVRAQVAGFRAVVPWPVLSLPKKLFVAFCVLAALAALLLCLTTVLNLYVDTEVPVSLSLFKNVRKTGDGFVAVEGTWTRTDLSGDTIAFPLQTSKIECSKQERMCVEAKAYVSGNLLEADLARYDIQSWTDNAVVFTEVEGCATTVYTIDLNTEVVSGAGHLTNQDTTFCKMNLGSSENWSLLMTTGFNVYWEVRKNARPIPLKILHAAFGN
jgi:hypothetical protein